MDDSQTQAPTLTLRAKTEKYWAFGYRLNGRIGTYYTTKAAIDQTSALLNSIGPHRRLFSIVANIQQEIIDGSISKARPKVKGNVIPLLSPNTNPNLRSAKA